jgi:hypothetical protein
VKHPKRNNTPKNKRKPVPDDANSPAVTDVLDAPTLCRVVVDLKVKDNSYNEIVDFCARVLHIHVSKEGITAILIEAGKRAKHLNGIYDALVKVRTRYIVVDEIFQGQHNCFLGSADPASRYLLLFRGIKNRTEETLQDTLAELAAGFKRLELVITDGLRQYGVVVPEAFEDAVHLLCQVHAFRIILREQEKVDREARKAYSVVKSAREALASGRQKIYKKRRQLKAKQVRLAKTKTARDDDNLAHFGSKRHLRGVPWTPEQLANKARLNELQVETRSKAATVAGAEEKVPKLQQTLEKAEKKYRTKKQASLQAGRLVARFKALLKSSPAEFVTKKVCLESILAGSKNPIAGKLRAFLKDHPEAFATKVPDLDALCPPSAANTNAIEGIFGLLRPLLKKARRFGATPATAAVFEIVRLHHNLTPPFTGPHKGTSPLERAGVHSQYADYLDAIFPASRATAETGGNAGNEVQNAIIEGTPFSPQASENLLPVR